MFDDMGTRKAAMMRLKKYADDMEFGQPQGDGMDHSMMSKPTGVSITIASGPSKLDHADEEITEGAADNPTEENAEGGDIFTSETDRSSALEKIKQAGDEERRKAAEKYLQPTRRF
jgi:hypothetical protein